MNCGGMVNAAESKNTEPGRAEETVLEYKYAYEGSPIKGTREPINPNTVNVLPYSSSPTILETIDLAITHIVPFIISITGAE